MSPYRSREQTPVAPRKEGLVADMVRQFADPYAFLRELLQNGIDAGAKAIRVAVEAWPGDVVVTSVADDGCGMPLEVIEGGLLTLFSSTKEGDLGKIGKYGVGFVSVLALEPHEVRVDTWRSGQAWRVRLTPDHRYTVEEATPREGSGTVVEVHKRMPREEVGLHATRARSALRRWCRHAPLPVTFVLADRERGAEVLTTRIDVPLAVWGPVSVIATDDDETVVVGPSAGSPSMPGFAVASPDEVDERERAPSFAGFYNRGLTLYETTVETFPDLAGVRFKVVSPRLKHTLSRDNVRRDEAFERVLERVRALVRAPLRAATRDRLVQAARVAAEGAEPAAAYAATLEAALSPQVALDPKAITFPLTDPVQGAVAVSNLLGRTPGRAPLWAVGPDDLTAALAKVDHPVVRVVHPAVRALLTRAFPSRLVEHAHSAYLLVREVESDGDAARLVEEVARAVNAAGEEIAAVSLGVMATPRTAVVVPEPGLHSASSIEAWWRSWSARHRLVLNVDSGAVRDARALAARDARAAGLLLARALLVEGRFPLDARANARLLELGGAGR